MKWLRAAYDVWTENGEYAEYKALGGGGWARIDAGRKRGADEYRNALFKGYDTRNMKEDVKTAGKLAWKLVTFERFNEIIEQTSRYAEYKYGQHDKSTPDGRMKAFLASQDATVDFYRSGNSSTAQAVHAVMPFSSASMQGVYRIMRMFTDERERSRLPARFVKTVVNTALISALCAGLLRRDLDDDEQEEFTWLSDDLKAQNFFIPNFVPEVFGNAPLLRIPIEQDPLACAVHGLVTNAIWGGDEAVIDIASIADSIIDNMNPIQSTIFQPVIDAYANRTWYGSRIVPTRMNGWDTTTQYTEETPGLFRIAGRVIGQSPLKLQYLAEQYTGFVGQMGIPAISYKEDGKMGGISAAINAARRSLTSDPLVSNDVINSFYDGSSMLDSVVKAVKNNRPLNMLRANLTDEEAAQAYQAAYDLTHSGGVVHDVKQAISEAYAEIDTINSNTTLSDDQRYELTSAVRRRMIEETLVAQGAIGSFMERYVTGKTLVSRIFEGVYTSEPTAYDLMPQTFADDIDQPYMQQAKAVYEATGKSSALPHPNQSFTVNGTTYSVDEADWDNFTLQYKMAYQKVLVGNSKGWDHLTDEERLDILGKAHTAGSNAAKKWYTKLKKNK